MCWLYSVTNLLVIQQLDTMYLGGNHVRVVCERVWRFQVCVHSGAFSRLEFVSGLRLMTRQNATRVKHVGSWRVMTIGALQDKKGQSGQSVFLRLELATCPSWEWVARMPCFAEKWLFTFLIYLTINTLILTKCRELPERILREKPYRKQNWLIHNLRHLILQTPLLSPSPMTYPWEDT